MNTAYCIYPTNWNPLPDIRSPRASISPLEVPEASTPAVGEIAEIVTEPHWLVDIYSWVNLKKFDIAIDILFEKIDDLLIDGQFDECNELLLAIDIKRLDHNLIVATLSITSAA